MHHSRGTIALIALLLLLPTAAPAKVQMSIDVGWGNRYRPGRWTPVYVTAADDAPRQVVLEMRAPTDRRYAVKISQGFAIGQTPVTVPLYVPLSYSLEETVVTLRDANSGRRLEVLPLSDYNAYQRMAGTPESISSDDLFIGISGNAGAERLLFAQFNNQRVFFGSLPPVRLPAVPAGYEPLDVLILNQPDLSRVGTEPQHAIMEWVRAGGTLLMLPGPGPIPAAGPIIDSLPCKFGQNIVYDLPKDRIAAAGLPERFAKLPGRAVAAVASTAKEMKLFGDSKCVGYRHWVGFGQIVAIPADVSTLMFSDNDKSIDFWRNALRGVVAIPIKDDNQNRGYNYEGETHPRQMYAMRKSLNWIGDVPGAGTFGFSYIASILIALMFIVGPVDWFVLKWIGRQPWTWVTITGWIGVVTLSAIYIGHVFKSGELHFRTVSLLDEADGARVGSVDVMGIYSPQTTRYNVGYESESWWRPASEINMYGGASGLQTEIPCHQDYHGNRPLPLLINVWNLRFLRGEQTSPAAPMITSKLTQSGTQVQGTITNQSEAPIHIVALRTGKGTAHFSTKIEPGASAPITAKLDPTNKNFATTRVSQQERWRIYQDDGATTRPSLPIAGDLAAMRSDRLEQMLKDEPNVGCVYAQYEAPPDRVKLDDPSANREHIGFIRALVPIE